MKQQTAVEFAVEKLEKFIPSGNQLAILAILEQAKKMEKNNLEKFYDHGSLSLLETGHGDTFEKYYNKTFKNK
jgi:hypothetical protein